MVSFLWGVPAPAWVAHGLQSLRDVCYSVGSSTGGRPLRFPLRHGIPPSVSQPRPLPRFSLVFFKRRLLLYLLLCLLSPSLRCALRCVSPGGAAAAAPRAPLTGRRGGSLSSLSEPAGTGTGQRVAPSHTAPCSPCDQNPALCTQYSHGTPLEQGLPCSSL